MVFIEKIKTKVSGFFYSAKEKLTRSETYKILLPALLVCALLLGAAPLLFDNSALKKDIENKISTYLKADFKINGKVEVALVPSPSITMNEVVLQNYFDGKKVNSFNAKQIKVKLSFLYSLAGKFVIKEILFINSDFENHYELFKDKESFAAPIDAPSSQKTGGVSAKLFSIKDVNLDKLNNANFPRIALQNASLTSANKLGKKTLVKAINGNIRFSKKTIIASGNFTNNETVNNIQLKARFNREFGDNSSNLTISSSSANIQVTGDFLSDNNGLLNSKFRGLVEAQISDLKGFYKSYVATDGFVYDKINPNSKPIKLKGTLINNGDGILLDNIAITSAVVTGRGNITIDPNLTIPTIDIKLIMETIDLDAIWLSDKDVQNNLAQDKTQMVEEAENSSDENKNLPDASLNASKDLRDFDLTAEVTVSRVKYLNEEVKNVSLYTSISKDGEILIMPLALEIPGGGLFRMNGAIANQNSPRFVGTIYADGTKLADIFKWLGIEVQNLKYENLKEYSLFADILITPGSATLNNFYLNVNKGKDEVLGDMSISYINKTSNIISNFRLKELNLDDYFLTSGQNIYLSPGSLLKKLLWLNNLTSHNDLTLNFDKLLYKGNVFDNQNVKMRFGQGYFEIMDLKLNATDFDLTTSIAIDISDKDPKFDLKLKSKNFVYHNSEIKTQDQTIKFTALDQFFALPSLEGFNGKIAFDIQNADFDGFSLEDVKINGKLKDGDIEFSQFICSAYGGNINYQGGVAIKFDKAISGNITASNVALRPLLSDLFKVRDIGGNVNISASIVANAHKKEDLSKEITSDIKFSAAMVTVDNWGLNDLVKKMFNPRIFANDLKNVENIYNNSQSKTILSKAIGAASIAKGRDGKFKIDFSTPGANGITSGTFNLNNNTGVGKTNIIFLTGDRKKQTPLNIASAFSGPLDNIIQKTNLDQVKQYLGQMPRRAANDNNVTEQGTAPTLPDNNVKKDLNDQLNQQLKNAGNNPANMEQLMQQIQTQQQIINQAQTNGQANR